mgnify:CR=1 FL=1
MEQILSVFSGLADAYMLEWLAAVLLILAAWTHVRARNAGALKEKYLYMTQVQSKGKKIAIVAVARKLAELMYTILKNGTSYEKRTSPTLSMEKLVDEALAS